MSSFRDLLIAGLLVATAAAQAQPNKFPGVGRAATDKEVAAWDIDVRPDFKGLPKGQGTVAKGMEVWEGKCASCHGVFGESNEVFNPLVGGTTKDDIKSGHVARLNDRAYPGRTTLMKVSTVSTLWDYINRAMPWNAPKSLSTDEVYGVTAYMLHLGGILPEGFTLSDQNIAEVQKLLPNRNGMTTDHALWPGTQFGKRKPDVVARACMKDCAVEPAVSSFLPDFARNAHGNLAEQNRTVGAQRGADTTQPPLAALSENAAQGGASGAVRAAAVQPPSRSTDTGGAGAAVALTQKYACVACHALDSKILGPAFREVAKKYAARADAISYLSDRIKAGGSGVWGAIPMPPQTLGESDANAIARWLADGAKK